MKILSLSHIYPPAIDGGSRVIFKLSEYFSKNNELLAITSDCKSSDDFITPSSTPVSNHGYTDPYQVFRLPVYKNLRKVFKAISILIPTRYLKDFFLVLSKGPVFKLIPFLSSLRQVLRFSPDLILCGPLPTSIVLYAHIYKKLVYFFNRKKPLILLNCSFHPTDLDFHRLPLINAIKKSDFIWSLTRHESKIFTEKFSFPKDKIILAGNGVEINLISGKNKQIGDYLLFVGSMSSHKNIEDILIAYKSIAPNNPNLKLIIAGQKTLYSGTLEVLVNLFPKDIKSRISFKYFPSDSEIIKLYDQAFALIQSSSQESFGLVTIEAMARGLPVIGADIPATKQLINDSDAGLTYRSHNVQDLILKINLLLGDPALYKKISLAGPKYVKNFFTWDKIGEKIWLKISS